MLVGAGCRISRVAHSPVVWVCVCGCWAMQKRDYLLHRKSASWLYMSRLAALRVSQPFPLIRVAYNLSYL